MRYLFLILSLFALWPSVVFGFAKKDFKQEVYDRWAQLPNDSLMSIGNRYIYTSESQKQDMALLCFTIVSNRFYANQYTREDLTLIIDAFNNLGYMYMLVFFDYQKSFSTLDQARQIAEKEEVTRNLPMIYLNIALLRMISNETQQSGKNIDETILALKKPFYVALQHKATKPSSSFHSALFVAP